MVSSEADALSVKEACLPEGSRNKSATEIVKNWRYRASQKIALVSNQKLTNQKGKFLFESIRRS